MSMNDFTFAAWGSVPSDTVMLALVAMACLAAVAGLAIWARALWIVYRPARAMIARLERLTAALEAAPRDIAPFNPEADYRKEVEDRLLLLEANGQGHSPRARALRRRLGMVG